MKLAAHAHVLEPLIRVHIDVGFADLRGNGARSRRRRGQREDLLPQLGDSGQVRVDPLAVLQAKPRAQRVEVVLHQVQHMGSQPVAGVPGSPWRGAGEEPSKQGGRVGLWE